MATILHSTDAGRDWKVAMDGERAAALMATGADARPAGPARDGASRNARQLVADGPDKPFLALAADGPRIIAVGANGLALQSTDGVSTWRAPKCRTPRDCTSMASREA